MRIEWDERKRLANLAKHGLDFDALTERFFNEAVIIAARKGRFLAIGRFSDGSIAVVFAFLGSEGVSVISMRPASPKERRLLDA